MHIAIIGGNGATGQHVITSALSRSHTVIALVRNPSTLESRSGLTILKGSPLNPADVDSLFSQPSSPVPDAVIITLNAPRESGSPFSKPTAPPRLMADSNANVRASMKKHGMKRVVVMSAFGVGESFVNLNFVMKGIVRHTNMASQFEDHECVEREMRTEGEGLQWSIVKPVMLAGEEEKDVVDLGENGERAGWWDNVARRSVARYLVEVAEGREAGRSVVIRD